MLGKEDNGSGQRAGGSKGGNGGRGTGRISPELKAEILEQVRMGRTKSDVARQYGVHPISITRWERQLRKKREGGGKAEGTSDAELLAPSGTTPRRQPGVIEEEIAQAIISLKREYPTMGPAQIRNQLRRFKGIWVSVRAIGRVLKEAGFELQRKTAPHKEGEERSASIDTTRPGELWVMDILQVQIQKEKGYLFCVMDHYSRYVVGWGLYGDAGADRALEVVGGAIKARGKPERLLTDRGSPFYAWRGETQFEKFLESEQIDHSVSRPRRPQTCGVVEALNKTIRRELLDVEEFENLEDARRGLKAFFEHYNRGRSHMGIGGITPEDRLLAREDRVRADTARMIRARMLRSGGELACGDGTADPATTLLQLVLKGDDLEVWFCGTRFVVPSA